MSEGKTGGQLAFETYVEIVTGMPGNWELEEPEDREAWEAAAAAGAAPAHERTAELVSEVNELRGQLTGVYRERAHLVAYLAAAYPSCIGPAPDAEGWAIVYIATPEQMSWHIDYRDLDLFGHVHVGQDEWDGHTIAEKYARLDKLTARKAGPAVVTSGAEHLAKLIGSLAIPDGEA